MKTTTNTGKPGNSKKFWGALIAVFLFTTSTDLQAQNGEAIFKQNCSACHSVGKGRLVGPDLSGVTNRRSAEWLLKFTKSSQGLIKSGDGDAKAIFNEYNQMLMPDFPQLSDADVQSVFAFIESKSPAVVETAKVEAVEEAVEEKPARIATKEDIHAGMNLFSGKKTFKMGGAACLSCHHVKNDGLFGGGTLAKELTTVHGKMGDAGLAGLLSSPPFPAMTVAYKDNKLTEDEIFQLAAFLKHADSERIYQQPRTYEGYFIWGGGLIFLTILFLVWITWFNRKKAMVKDSIFNRQTRSY
jgi:mono/diheme cytochrome c family protein